MHETTPELTTLHESTLTGGRGERRSAFRLLKKALERSIARGETDEAAEVLRASAVPGLDYTTAQSLIRLRRRIPEAPAASETRLAILGSVTTTQLAPLIELHLFARGVRAAVYTADYGVFRQEILDPGSALHGFAPRFVYLATSWRDLSQVPALGASTREVEACLEREYEEWSSLWERIHAVDGAQVIQDAFRPPPWRVLGNHEQRCPSSPTGYVRRLNARMLAEAPPYVTVHDVEQSLRTTSDSASDLRFYHHAKLPCAPERLYPWALGIAAIVAAHLGRSRKCLVLDLDNTLWGGVVGDDGVEGIRLGSGDAESEAFSDFQRYLVQLRRRGVLLAVCSANDEALAKSVFETHPGMRLKLEDVACFVANWENKASNLRRIAEELDIGLDSLVFFDDDPGQRSLVRRALPEVAVPEVSGDPSDYVATLEAHRYFEAVALEEDDLRRTAFYLGNRERRRLRASTGEDLDGFLSSLEMAARVEPVHPGNLARSAQLIGKTNQFNLTTRRHTQARVTDLSASPDWVTLTLRLEDRFGDNGLVSVLLARAEPEALVVDTWVMSCRVLRRGVERYLFNRLCEAARERGLTRIRGEYRPTPRNGLVRELYPSLGFRPLSGEEGGSWWELELDASWTPLQTFISPGA